MPEQQDMGKDDEGSMPSNHALLYLPDGFEIWIIEADSKCPPGDAIVDWVTVDAAGCLAGSSGRLLGFNANPVYEEMLGKAFKDTTQIPQAWVQDPRFPMKINFSVLHTENATSMGFFLSVETIEIVTESLERTFKLASGESMDTLLVPALFPAFPKASAFSLAQIVCECLIETHIRHTGFKRAVILTIKGELPLEDLRLMIAGSREDLVLNENPPESPVNKESIAEAISAGAAAVLGATLSAGAIRVIQSSIPAGRKNPVASSLLGPAGIVAGAAAGAAAGAFIGRWFVAKKPGSPNRDSRGSSPLKKVKETSLRNANMLLQIDKLNLQAKIERLESDLRRFSNECNAPLDSLEQTAAFPVAFAARAVNAELNSMTRQRQVWTSMSTVLRYLCSVLLAEYERQGAVSSDTNLMLKDVFSRPVTDGGRCHIILDLSRILKDGDYIGKARSLFWEEDRSKTHLNGCMQGLVQLRNEVHNLGSSGEPEARSWLDKAMPMWVRFLDGISSIARLKLVSVEQIENFDEDDSSKHIYYTKPLNGISVLPSGERILSEEKLLKNRLYLANPESDKYLALYPFMEYSPCSFGSGKIRDTSSIDHLEGDTIHFVTFQFGYKFDGKVKKLPRCFS